MGVPRRSYDDHFECLDQRFSTGGLGFPNTVSLAMHEAVKLALKQNPRPLAGRLEALESKADNKSGKVCFPAKGGVRA